MIADTRYVELADEALFNLIKNGDREAFSVLYRKYWPALLDAAYRRLKSVEVAQELVQDLFVSFYLKRNTLEVKESLSAYLHTALKYKVLNQIRADIVRNKYHQHTLSSPASVHADPSEIYQIRELQQQYEKAISELPEKCREVFLLSREENLSHQQIATQLGISVNTVEKHIGKALKIMRKNLLNYDLEVILFLGFIYQLRPWTATYVVLAFQAWSIAFNTPKSNDLL